MQLVSVVVQLPLTVQLVSVVVAADGAVGQRDVPPPQAALTECRLVAAELPLMVQSIRLTVPD